MPQDRLQDFRAHNEHGIEALTHRSRRPVRYPNQLPHPIERLIVMLKREKPHWSARKIRELMLRRLSGDIRVPARSTIHVVLDRHGSSSDAGGRARMRTARRAPDDLWCADFKGEFKLGNGRYCYPLTNRPRSSLALPAHVPRARIREELTFTAFERLFRERDLNRARIQRTVST